MSALDELAELAGIEPGYVDVAGERRVTSPEAKRALLVAMGFDVGSDAAATAARDELRAEMTRSPLPPAVTVLADAPVLELRRPVDAAHVVVELENGMIRVVRTAAAGDHRRPRLRLMEPLPAGYHRIRLDGAGDAAVPLVAAPSLCWTPRDAGIDRAWGLTCQAYGLCGRRDEGLGGYAEIAAAAEVAAGSGADLLGLSPIHALFPADHGRYSPYQPSTRRFLNAQMVSSEVAAALIGVPPPPLDGAALSRDAELVDYAAAVPRRFAALGALAAEFRARHLQAAPSPLGRAFLEWRAEAGPPLERLCRFDALMEARRAAGDTGPWWRWPAGLRRPDGPEVAAFAAQHADRVDFFAWLQWLAHRQLADAQERARNAGMRVGLYIDLAVGVASDGAETWSDPEGTLRGVSIGAPPDALGPEGQSWGVAPISPRALRQRAFAPFIADLRAAMRHAGAVRIDHAMGLTRLFWVPDGGSPATDGAYVRYPLRDLMRVLALESRRAHCIVVGEDLGTVPEGFRDAMARIEMLSSRVLWFEHEDGYGADRRYRRARRYPRLAATSASTHDLPTVSGWWSAAEIRARHWLGRVVDLEEQLRGRAADRRRLLALLAAERLIDPARIDPDAETIPEEVWLAIHRHLAATPSALVLVQIEDALRQEEQANLPGVAEGYPSWRRRYRLPVEALGDDPAARELFAMLARERPHG